MNLPHFRNSRIARLLLVLPLLWTGASRPALAGKGSSSSGSKPAAPSKPSGTSSSAGSTNGAGGARGSASSGSGISTNSPAGKGITTNAPAGRGVTANTPAGRGITANTPAGRGITTNSGASRGAAAPGGAARGTPSAGRAGTPAGGRAAPNGSHTVQTKSGDKVQMRANGKPSDVHVANRGMDIHNGLGGDRRVSVERGDHTRVVAERGGRGYVQHPYRFGEHEYGHRTYYSHGRAYDRFYRRYPYHGLYLDVYAPEFYYAPAFYGWAYNPWAAPVPYAWGWGAAPWYGYYGSYYAPYPVYPNASVWLTDYLISNSLADAYDAGAAAGGAGNRMTAANSSGATPLSPAVKDQIAAEVQRQIQLESTEAHSGPGTEMDPESSSIRRILADPSPHVFVAGGPIDTVNISGAECAITEGDALQLTGLTPDGASARMSVLATKGGLECKAGATVTVTLADLQDMQNHMREAIDQGMGELATNKGKGGLPSPPSTASPVPMKSAFAASAPPPDANASGEINEQAKAADAAETQALTEVASETAPRMAAPVTPAPVVSAPPSTNATLTVGESVDGVTAALGQPQKVVDLGTKKVYMYQDLKVTFTGGKVSNID